MSQVGKVSDAISKIKSLNKVNDLSEYGRDFQIKLMSLLINDRNFSLSIIPIIKSEYFTDIYLKRIFMTISSYVDRYSTCPTLDNIRILLLDQVEKILPYDKMLKDINDMSIEDRDFIIDNARKFCFSRHALNENDKVIKHLEKGEFEEARSISFDSFKFSGLDTTKVYNLKEDFGMIFDEETVHNPIPMVFPTFNNNMQGGPGAGNLVIMVAPSNFGKTMLLVAMARHANMLGKTAVFFSFEIGGIDIIRRHLAGIFKIDQQELKNNRRIIEIKMGEENIGNFILIEEKATTARISTIKTHLEQLKSQKIFPHMILVDSLNQLKLPLGMRYEGDNQKFEYLAEELRDLAKEEEVPLYTVFQGNRSSFTAEINDEQNIGKAIEPLQVADVLVFMSQPKGEMIANGTCYANLLKNRLGKKGIILLCKYDPAMCYFEELEQVDELNLLSSKEKENVKNTAIEMRNKLKQGLLNKSKVEEVK